MKKSRIGICLSVVGLLALFGDVRALPGNPTGYPTARAVLDPGTSPLPPAQPIVEAVFVLDSTGSMSGLIEGAKAKIWSIAHTLASAKPTPAIRIGLVTYRDRGDEYVTKQFPLTEDLDAIFETLMSYQAGGGGDGPESVNQALDEAISRFPWSSGKNVFRVVFLVGDFPPHMDYQDDVKYQLTCDSASTGGIIINTILCGGNRDAERVWREISKWTNGTYAQLAQSGDAILMETPYDPELAELSRELDKTRIYYGTVEVRDSWAKVEAASERIAASAPQNARAQRAAFYASETGRSLHVRGNELVNDYAGRPDELASLERDKLPAELQSLTLPALKDHVLTNAARRKNINERIQKLSELRQAYIRGELDKNAGREEASLEFKLFDAIRDQSSIGGMQSSLSAGIY